MQAKVVAVCISKNKGERKTPVASVELVVNHGIAGDAHAGEWHRQVSLLAQESVAKMQAMGLEIPEIDAAIQALAINKTDMVLKDLQTALTDLSKIKEMAKNMQQLQQQLEKIGKDLAEQLQNGQPEAAHMTLQKMMQQLKSSELSSEQLSKLMQEVSKAPAWPGIRTGPSSVAPPSSINALWAMVQ